MRKYFVTALPVVMGAVLAILPIASTAMADGSCETNVAGQPITAACQNQFAVMCNAPALDGVCNNSLPATATYGANLSVSGPNASVGGVYCGLNFGLGNTSITGDVLASGFDSTVSVVNINGLPAHSVSGTCVDGDDNRPGTITRAGACAGGEDTNGASNPLLAFASGTPPYLTAGPLFNATVDEENFDTALLKCPVNGVNAAIANLGAISVASNHTATLNALVPPLGSNLSIIIVPSVSLASNSKLILSGTADDQLVLETPGQVLMAANSKIVLAGGLTANHVLITTTTDPSQVAAANTGVHVGANSVLEGTIHGEGGCVIGASVTVSGSLTCDFGTNIGANLKLYHIQNDIALPFCTGVTPCGTPLF